MRTSSMRRLVFLGAVALVLNFVCVACEDEETDGEGYTFSGTITDSVQGTPIESARVSIADSNGVTFYSDSTGHYQGGTWGGRFTIFAQKQGYQTQNRELHVTRNMTGVDFKLTQ